MSAGRAEPEAGRRIVYIQYTNPAGYPPLQHSSRIMADRGCRILFLAAPSDGSASLTFPPHPSITVRRLPSFGSGLMQKLNYACYVAWTLLVCLWWRPHWVYASEPMSCPPALAIRRATRCRILYHEHDSPVYREPLPRIQRLFRAARLRIARTADICVLPQQRRLELFVAETGRTGPTLCVWNCPSRDEVAPARAAPAAAQPMRFYYHGSINATRLPMSILAAMSRAGPGATLTVVGYQTIGSPNYMSDFLRQADRLGLAMRVSYLGPLAMRSQILAHAGEADVGLAFMPVTTNDPNMAHMTGASNKAFDYLAVGTMPIVSDTADWRTMYVEPGYALACDPGDVESLTSALAWCVANPDRVRAMGEAGRRRIADEWNYERQFESVAAMMFAPRSSWAEPA